MKNPFRTGSFGVVVRLRHRLAFWKRGAKKILMVSPEIEGEVIANGAIECCTGVFEKNPRYLPAKSQAHKPEFRNNRFGEAGTRNLIVIECVDGEFISATVAPYTQVRKSAHFSATAALSIALAILLATLIGKHAYDGMASNSVSSTQIASNGKLEAASPFPPVKNNIPEAHEISRPVDQTGLVETTVSSKPTLGEIESRPAATQESVITMLAPTDKQTFVTEVLGSSENGPSQQVTETTDVEKTASGNVASTNSLPLSASEGAVLGKLNPTAGDGDKIKNTFHAARHKSSAHSKPRESSGATVIGRTLNTFAKQFSNDLRRLPRQISSIFEQ